MNTSVFTPSEATLVQCGEYWDWIPHVTQNFSHTTYVLRIPWIATAHVWQVMVGRGMGGGRRNCKLLALYQPAVVAMLINA